jgi:general secretion pathway protein M
MIARVQAWYTGLTTRERTLVTIAGALAGLIVLIYGIVLPVGRAFDAADAPCGVGAAHGTADGGAAAARCPARRPGLAYRDGAGRAGGRRQCRTGWVCAAINQPRGSD